MHRQPTRFDLVACQRATAHVVRLMEKYRRTIEDPERTKRLAQQECPICYYIDGRIGGAAMTSTECGRCGKPMTFGNTCVDAVCFVCALACGVCHHCGADMDGKMRRKLPPAPDTSLLRSFIETSREDVESIPPDERRFLDGYLNPKPRSAPSPKR